MPLRRRSSSTTSCIFELSRFAKGVRILMSFRQLPQRHRHSCRARRNAIGGWRPALRNGCRVPSAIRPTRSTDLLDKVQRDVARAAAGKVSVPDPDARARAGQVGDPRRRRAIARPFGPSVILISGCQDNQTSMDGDHNGAFTEQLLKVWNHGWLQRQVRKVPRRHQGGHAVDADAEPVFVRRRRTVSRSAPVRGLVKRT